MSCRHGLLPGVYNLDTFGSFSSCLFISTYTSKGLLFAHCSQPTRLCWWIGHASSCVKIGPSQVWFDSAQLLYHDAIRSLKKIGECWAVVDGSMHVYRERWHKRLSKTCLSKQIQYMNMLVNVMKYYCIPWNLFLIQFISILRSCVTAFSVSKSKHVSVVALPAFPQYPCFLIFFRPSGEQLNIFRSVFYTDTRTGPMVLFIFFLDFLIDIYWDAPPSPWQGLLHV